MEFFPPIVHRKRISRRLRLQRIEKALGARAALRANAFINSRFEPNRLFTAQFNAVNRAQRREMRKFGAAGTAALGTALGTAALGTALGTAGGAIRALRAAAALRAARTAALRAALAGFAARKRRKRGKGRETNRAAERRFREQRRGH